MGFFDRARALLGLERAAEKAADRAADAPGSSSSSEAVTSRRKRREDRPPLPEPPASPAASLEDVLTARAAGDRDRARTLLAGMDRGKGLRAVLRAAAALEAGDEVEVDRLLPGLVGQEPSWQLTLQLAAALDDGEQRRERVRAAERLGAPAWAIAWIGALSSDSDEQRKGLVDLLFEDPGLARTVAARDLALPKVVADHDAVARYAAFAHGRDVVRRFGAAPIAELLDRLSPARA